MHKLSFILCLAIGCAGVLSSSCTWRDVGCVSGSFSAGLAARVLIDSYEAGASKNKNYRPLSDMEKNAIVTTAQSIGCMAGSEFAGALEDYTNKKREEYRNEAAYLQAQIDDMDKTIAKADDEIAWLNNQAERIREENKKIKQLPAMKQEMGAKLKATSRKRVADAAKLEKYLVDAKNDSKSALGSTQEEAKKAELRKEIAELDKRIKQTREARENIIMADAGISYV